jgi:hypothetical protein
LIERSAAGRRGVWLRRAAVFILVGVVLAFERQGVERFYLLKVAALDMAQANFCLQSDRLLPRQALLVATEMSGAIKFYMSRPIVRHERVGADQWQTLQARAAEKGYQWYALLLSQEVEEAQKRLPGRWTRLGMLRQISLWQIETAKDNAP